MRVLVVDVVCGWLQSWVALFTSFTVASAETTGATASAGLRIHAITSVGQLKFTRGTPLLTSAEIVDESFYMVIVERIKGITYVARHRGKQMEAHKLRALLNDAFRPVGRIQVDSCRKIIGSGRRTSSGSIAEEFGGSGGEAVHLI